MPEIAILMQPFDLQRQTRASAERAAINETKQKILFKWHRNHRPTQHNVFCTAKEYPIYQKAVAELDEQYPSTIFKLFWHN